MIGTSVAHFQIEGLLGAGGMGEVYRARDTRLGRAVAIKVLPETLAGDADRATRFEREARLLAALNHSNIAALYGLEQAAGRHFLVMELVEGDTLADVIARGQVEIAAALKIAHQIAEALEAAHEKGIIHRDLKPANVKITPDGKVKVLDFGLAKAFLEASPETAHLNTHSPTLSVMATNAGMILGTAGYMSPEQARGHNTDARSDIFSFACVLYEILTGRQAFQGETVTDVIASVVARDPDWRALPTNLHPKTEELLRRCLAKNRKDRWHAIADVRVELELMMADPHGLKLSSAREAPKPPWWRRALPVAAAAIVAASIGVVVTVAVMKERPAPAIVTRFPVVLPDTVRFTNNARNQLAISPDGTTIVFEANQQLYIRSMGDVESRPIQATAQNAATPFFSPDGRWVGFATRSDLKLKKIAVTGGAAVTIADNPSFATGGYGPVWNSDGYIYTGQIGAVMRVPATGGTLAPVITLKPNEAAHRPQLLPDGDGLLFTLAAAGVGGGFDRWDKAQIVVQSLKTGERKTVIRGGSDGRYVPTGHLLYMVGNTMLAVPFDVKRLEVSGGPVPVIEGVRRSAAAGGGGADAQLAIAGNGSMVYVAGSQTPVNDLILTLVDQSGVRRQLNAPPAPYVTPRISPDGKRFAVHSDDGRDVSVWIGDLNDATPIHKLTSEGRSRDPLWTLDGERVAFVSDRGDPNGVFNIFWQRVDGGPAERLGSAAGGARPQLESWSPDGKTLVFSNRANTAAGISLLVIGGEQKPQLIVKPPATNSSLSPDGRWLAYSSNESGRGEIYVEPYPPTGEKHPITTDGAVSPLWARDGKRLYFLKGAQNPRQLEAVDVQTQRGFAFGKITVPPIPPIVDSGPRSYDVSPDGKTFLVMLPKGQSSDKAPPEQINVTLNWFEDLKQRVPSK